MSNNIQCNLCRTNINRLDEIASCIDYENGTKEIICIDCIQELIINDDDNDDNNNDDGDNNNNDESNGDLFFYRNCRECGERRPALNNNFDFVCYDCIRDNGELVQENNIKCCNVNCNERATTVDNSDGCLYCDNCNYYDYMNFLQRYKQIYIKKELNCENKECPVCLDEKECQSFFKCPHLMCEPCNNKLNRNLCPICRNNEVRKSIEHPISELIELFNQDNFNQYPFSENAMKEKRYFDKWYFQARQRYYKLVKKSKIFNTTEYDNSDQINGYRYNMDRFPDLPK